MQRKLIERRAYSTLEVVVTLSIIAVTTAIAAPRFAASMQRTKIERAAALIAADIARARENARAYGMDQTIAFSGSRYALTTRTATRTSTQTVDLFREPFENAVNLVRTGSFSSVTFNAYGSPSNSLVVGLRSGTLLRVLTLQQTGDIAISESITASTEFPQEASAAVNAYSATQIPD